MRHFQTCPDAHTRAHLDPNPIVLDQAGYDGVDRERDIASPEHHRSCNRNLVRDKKVAIEAEE